MSLCLVLPFAAQSLGFVHGPAMQPARFGSIRSADAACASKRLGGFCDSARRLRPCVTALQAKAGLVPGSDVTAQQTAEPAAEPPVSDKRTPATEYFKPLVEGDMLLSTGTQRAIVAGSAALLLAIAVKAAMAVALSPVDTQPLLLIVMAVLGYEFADVGSGVYHWAMDNYGDKDTPIFGTQVRCDQGAPVLRLGCTSSCAAGSTSVATR